MNDRQVATGRRAYPIWLCPALAFLIALTFRILYFFSISDFILFNTPTGDSIDYFNFARQIISGSILGKDILFHSSPIYPYFLAPLLAFDLTPAFIALTQLLLGAIAAPLIVVLARRMGGEMAGWLAAGIYLLIPAPIFYDGELLADFPLVTGMVGLVLLAAKPKLAWWLAVLVALGTFALVLAKPNLALVAVILAITRLWLYRRQTMSPKERWVVPLALVLGVILAVGGTFTRNMIVKDEPVILTTSGGVNFWIGNHQGAQGAFSVPPDLADRLWMGAKKHAIKEVGSQLTDGQVQGYYYSQGFDYILNNPGDYLASIARRTRILLNRYELPNHQDLNFFSGKSWILRILPLGWWLIIPLAIGGMLVLRGRIIVFTNVAFLSYALSLVMVFFVTGRYRYPLLGISIALAAAFLAWLWRNWRYLKWTTGVLLALVIILTAFLAFLPLPSSVMVSYSYSYHHIGFAYTSRGDLKNAITAYEDALSYSPDDAFSMNNLGLIYMQMGKFDKATQLISEAGKYDPSNADLWANLGGALAGGNDLFRAEQALGQALALDPGNAAALTNLAVVRLQQGNIAMAIELCKKALMRDPELKQAQELLKYLSNIRRR